MTYRYGTAQLTIRYDCEHGGDQSLTTSLFECLLSWLERCQLYQPSVIARFGYMIQLGTSANENCGRLGLMIYTVVRNDEVFWKWAFIKCFQSPSEYMEDSLDRLYHCLDERDIPIEEFHRSRLEHEFQLLHLVEMSTTFTRSTISIVKRMTEDCIQKVSTHFFDFIWTFNETYDVPNFIWKFPVEITGNLRDRSAWVRKDWHRIQRRMEWAWENLKILRNNAALTQSFPYQGSSSCDLLYDQIDNFLPTTGTGVTFEWKWNTPFRNFGVAFYRRNRTRVYWGSHPFTSVIENESFDHMRLFGSEQLVARFTAQSCGSRKCDTVVFEAECTEGYLTVDESQLKASLCYLLGHFLEKVLDRVVENTVFDGLGQFGPQFWNFFSLIYECCELNDVQRYPFRMPDEVLRVLY
jgi:hypothetical protein